MVEKRIGGIEIRVKTNRKINCHGRRGRFYTPPRMQPEAMNPFSPPHYHRRSCKTPVEAFSANGGLVLQHVVVP